MIPLVMNVAGAYFTLWCDGQGGKSHRADLPLPLWACLKLRAAIAPGNF